MASVLSRWRGKPVTVFYADRNLVEASGKMHESDDTGIMIELPGGRTFIPLTAILHIVGPVDV